MRSLLLLFAFVTGLLLPSLAHATATGATIGVWLHTDGRAVPPEAARALLWHGLLGQHGHEAVFLDPDSPDAAAHLRAWGLDSLLVAELRWHRTEVHLACGAKASARAPSLHITEHGLVDGQLQPRASWRVHGDPAVSSLPGESGAQLAELPLVALQDVLASALEPVIPPVWHQRPPRLHVPVVLAADTAYREHFGEDWATHARRRVELASRILGQAGLALRVVDEQAWDPPTDAAGLDALLRSLHAQPRSQAHAVRVGFTLLPEVDPGWGGEGQQVGLAHILGRDAVVAARPLSRAALWDEAAEAAAIAHEVLHALGVRHEDASYTLMAVTNIVPGHRISPAAAGLARAAAHARHAHWDPLAAATGLAFAAEAWLHDVDQQLDFVLANLALGPGLPSPGSVSPTQLPAVANLALGRHYLRLADHSSSSEAKALREVALAHTAAVLIEAPPSEGVGRRAAQVVEALAVHEAPGQPLVGLAADCDDPWHLQVCR